MSLGLMTRVCLVLVAGLVVPRIAMGIDTIALPAAKRSFVSSSGCFELVVTRPERIRPGLFPRATLYRTAGAGDRERLWERALDIYIGPRFVHLTDTGVSVLVDEWLRKRETKYAVQVFAPDGERLYAVPLSDVVAVTGLEWRQISDAAKHGPWLSSEPTLVSSHKLRLEVGKMPLVLRLTDGSLTLEH